MSHSPVVPRHTNPRHHRQVPGRGPAYLRGLPASMWRRALPGRP